METEKRRRTHHTAPARDVVLSAVQAALRREAVPPLYLATGRTCSATGVLGAAAAAVHASGQSNRLLVCTGDDFVTLWLDTLRRGMTPIIRRALEAKHIILVDGLEALHGEAVAEWELARLLDPCRLVVLAGRGHLRHVAAWNPLLSTRLFGATRICLHTGPCVTDADARAVIDRVARHYSLTPGQLLSRRRPANIALARQVAMHMLREEGLTASHVGRLLRRDHSTVLYGDAHIRCLSAYQPGVRNDLVALRRAIAA